MQRPGAILRRTGGKVGSAMVSTELFCVAITFASVFSVRLLLSCLVATTTPRRSTKDSGLLGGCADSFPPWCLVGNEGMDPYSSPYIVSNNSLHNPFPHSLLSTRESAASLPEQLSQIGEGREKSEGLRV